MATEDGVLYHLSLNEPKAQSIVLLHGLGTSHNEWALVWPHLTSYHLLIPDLSGHSASAHVRPATIPSQAERVAALIETHAHGGEAHVVGLSMGGFVALELARTQPKLVRSVFATGCAPFTGTRLWVATHPGVLGALNTFTTKVLPTWASDWLNEVSWSAQSLTIPDDLKKDTKQNARSELIVEVFRSLGVVELQALREVSVRSLAVAGGKMDDVKGTTEQGAALKVGCSQSQAVMVREAWHGWDLQLPELFAAGVAAWVEEQPLPKEFEELI